MTAVGTDRAPVSWAGAAPLTSLRGREREQSALNQVLLDVLSGRSRVLVVRGEPGIGKTALLEDFCRRAGDVVVIRGVGIESESELAFAGLQQICSQIPREILELLSEPQRDAIRVALGSSAGVVPSPLLLGAAMLEHLADMAERRPVVVVIDDAQWLDRPTAQTLAFVARRIDTESLGLVLAVREQSQQLRGLPELIVEGLATVDAHKLLASALVAPVDEQVRERFIAETMGNPLAILELCHMLPGLTGFEETAGRRDSRGLWAQLEEAFARRIDALSPRSRRLSLIAAAEPLGDPVLMWRAADILQIPRNSADELEDAGLVHIRARVVFRHPVVRSVVYRHSRPAARRLVHEALAQAVDEGSDPEYRAWHRALAANGPDEEVAAELESSAGRATRRGGLGAAASFLERAVMLSEDVRSRGRRALVAAEAQLDAGQPSSAEALISIAQLAAETDLEVAQREVLEARLAYTRGRGRGAPALLLSAARRLDALGGTSPRDIYHRAMIAAIFAGRLSDGTTVADVAAAARASPIRRPTSLQDLHMRAIAALAVDGHATAAPLARQLIAALRERDLSSPDEAALLGMGIQFSTILWDDESWVDLASRGLRLARNLGCLDVLPIALCNQASAHAWQGEFAAATELVHELRALSNATGVPELATPAMTVSVYGPPGPAFELIYAAREAAAKRGEGLIVTFSEITEAILCNSLGRYEDAWRAAASAYADPLLYNPYLLGELLESAARSGHPERAVAARADLSARAAAANTDWAWGIETRSEALFNEGEQAERLYRASIEHLQCTRMRVQLARSHLLYGEWLRREGRRVDARQQLRTAHDLFHAMRVVVFTERATQELAATGETARKRTNAPDNADELTVREAQIARLAATGLSNRQIGEQLFISHRTVGYHLAKVFVKLGVNNRALIRADMLEDGIAGTRRAD
jgi:DNA-binding CsgD family transcriptional regulator